MRRRDFIAGLGSLAAWPALGEETGSERRVGVLMNNAPEDPFGPPRIAIMQRGLQELGRKDGQNIRFDVRWTGSDVQRIKADAADLVRHAPDVILATSSATLGALRDQTSTIPIVFVNVTDPVGSGILSLAKPIGNVTGFSNFEFAFGAKWLELLKEMVPAITRVFVVFNPDTAPAGGEPFVRVIERAGQAIAVRVLPAPTRSDAEIENAFATFAAGPGGGYIVLPDNFTTVHRVSIFQSAAQHRIPGVYPFPAYTSDGALLTYGPITDDLWRMTPTYLDRILRGAKPADLPVQLPTKYRLVVNLRTAKAMSLSVPDAFLVRADEVIE